MIVGIGTDIMRISRLRPENLREGDPFFLRSFSPGEIRQGLARPDSQAYFAARFAGKEALFKALRIPPGKGGVPRDLYSERRKRRAHCGIFRYAFSFDAGEERRGAGFPEL